MSCKACRKVEIDRKHEERNKIRELARRIAEIDGKTQILLEYGGELSITCEECWVRGGRIGRPVEYFIV
jgi:hypothetical protein